MSKSLSNTLKFINALRCKSIVNSCLRAMIMIIVFTRQKVIMTNIPLAGLEQPVLTRVQKPTPAMFL